MNACRFWNCLPSQLMAEDVSVLRMMEVYTAVRADGVGGDA